MIPAAEADGSDAAQQHLRPAEHRQRRADETVRKDNAPSNAPEYSLFQMQLQINAKDDLRGQQERDPVSERGMSVRRKLAAFMFVAKKVADDGEHDAEGLDGDVPSGPDELRVSRKQLAADRVDVVASEQGGEKHTPRTMPVGNRKPHATSWSSMCIHRTVSCRLDQSPVF